MPLKTMTSFIMDDPFTNVTNHTFQMVVLVVLVGGGGSKFDGEMPKGELPPVLKGIPKNVFEKIVLVFPIICDYMRHSTTQIYGGKLTIYDVSCRAI